MTATTCRTPMYCTYAATSYTCKPTAAGAGGPQAWSVVYSLLTTRMHYHRIRVSGATVQRGLLTTPVHVHASVPVPHRVVPPTTPPSSRIRAQARGPHPSQTIGFPKQKNFEAYKKRHSAEMPMRTDTRRAYERELEKKRKQAIRDYKESHPCVDCGVQYHYCVMQFDHIRGVKKFEISQSKKRSLKVVAEEIAKCDLVCANCHAIRTHTRLRKDY